MNEAAFRKLVRGIIDELLDESTVDEISTTGAVAGYETPNAFGKKHKDPTVGCKDCEEVEDDDELNEGRTRYHKLKNDQSRTAKKKIADSIREAKKAIREVKKTLKVISRYKNEFGYSHEQYWKSTQKNIYKMEEDLLAISKKLKELRS